MNKFHNAMMEFRKAVESNPASSVTFGGSSILDAVFADHPQQTSIEQIWNRSKDAVEKGMMSSGGAIASALAFGYLLGLQEGGEEWPSEGSTPSETT